MAPADLLLALNADVLWNIVSFLDAPDARELSRTNRIFHIVAKHQALTSVTLHSLASVIKFCRYFLGDMSHRLPALHALEVLEGQQEKTGHISEDERREAAQLLADVLDGARKLVLTGAETWFTHEDRIVDAIGSMTHLHEVDFRGLGGKTSYLIQHLRSTPYKLTLAQDEMSFSREARDQAFAFKDEFTMPSVQHFVTLGYAFHLPIRELSQTFVELTWEASSATAETSPRRRCTGVPLNTCLVHYPP